MNFALAVQSKKLEVQTSAVPTAEAQLIKRLVARERLAQKELYQQYFGKVLGIPLRYMSSKDEAYEVLNDAFLKVFNSIDRYQPIGSFGGWISKIVLHTTLDHVRKKYKYKERNEYNETQVLTVQNDALSNLGIQEIYKKIQMLPNASRAVFSMFVIDGLSHKEICEKLNISEGTSKWHLANARAKLQKLIKQ